MSEMTRTEAKKSAIKLWNKGYSLRRISLQVRFSHETVRQMLSEAHLNTSTRRPLHDNPVSNCRICGVRIPWPRKSLCLEHAKDVWRNNYKFGTEATREGHKKQVERYREKKATQIGGNNGNSSPRTK